MYLMNSATEYAGFTLLQSGGYEFTMDVDVSNLG
jgi:hypothetical protein